LLLLFVISLSPACRFFALTHLLYLGCGAGGLFAGSTPFLLGPDFAAFAPDRNRGAGVVAASPGRDGIEHGLAGAPQGVGLCDHVAASTAHRASHAATVERCLLYTSDAADDLLCVDL